jgi:hypothetical protein
MLSLYVIGSAFALLVLSARLREAHEELARVREECDDRARAVREEYAAYAYGVAVSLACLLAGLGAMAWCAPPGGAGRTAGGSQTETPADGPGGRTE